jgi:hypothetical protein
MSTRRKHVSYADLGIKEGLRVASYVIALGEPNVTSVTKGWSQKKEPAEAGSRTKIWISKGQVATTSAVLRRRGRRGRDPFPHRHPRVHHPRPRALHRRLRRSRHARALHLPRRLRAEDGPR